MRTNQWLRQQLTLIWYNFFPELKKENPIEIKFGRRCRTRLGSIKLVKKKTIITINGLFQNESVPDYVVTGTIAHELAHYAHGFSSPHPRLQRYPHQGGIVNKDLNKRGLENILKQQKKWLKENWQKYLEKHFPFSKTRRVRYVYKPIFWPF
jgi:predicted metal-dependent hydrolase